MFSNVALLSVGEANKMYCEKMVSLGCGVSGFLGRCLIACLERASANENGRKDVLIIKWPIKCVYSEQLITNKSIQTKR